MEHGSSLLTLGNKKSSSFSSDLVAQAAWKGSTTHTDASAGSGPAPIISNEIILGIEEKENDACLKEHDYIGLSIPTELSIDAQSPIELSLSETDLHLGLGLGLGPTKTAVPSEESEKNVSFTLTKKDGVPKAAMETPRYAFIEGGHALQKPWPNAGSMRPMSAENVNPVTSSREFQCSKVSVHTQDNGEGPSRVPNTFFGGHSAASKNGTKRGYTEAMNGPARFNTASTEVRGAASVRSVDGDAKAVPRHPQGAFTPNWAPSKPSLPAHWQVGVEQSPGQTFGPNKPAPVKTSPGVEKPVADVVPSAFKHHEVSKASEEPATNEPPPSKDRVVGWPPIRAYRKHTLAKPTEMFVKVNMDGMTVGRKVDLNAHSSYEGLLSALEEMFQPSSNSGQGMASGNEAKQFKLLHGSDFVLTYEDKDGDWMLVGDVPWSMFVSMVRRLRITRGSEATGLAPRRPDKIKQLTCKF